jgi:hypothetical protein
MQAKHFILFHLAIMSDKKNTLYHTYYITFSVPEYVKLHLLQIMVMFICRICHRKFFLTNKVKICIKIFIDTCFRSTIVAAIIMEHVYCVD